MRRTRPLLLLALAVLLAPRAEASRTSVWERNPPASLTVARTEAASALASLAPADAADIETEEPPRFYLGDLALVERELEHEVRFDLGPLTLVDLNLLRGPPPSYPETRVGGFELLPPFRIGAPPSLSLWGRQACGFSCREVVSDSRYDPWGLEVHKSLGCPPGQTCMGALEYENITTVGPRRSAMPPTMRAVPPRSRGSYTLGFVKATGNALISPGLALDPVTFRDPEGYYFSPSNAEESHAMAITDSVYMAGFVGQMVFGRGVVEAPVKRPGLPKKPTRRGQIVEDVRAGETYSEEAGYERAAPGTARADFRDTFGIEKVELSL